MSKIGKTIIKIKDDVKITDEKTKWTITGPKGSVAVNKIDGIEVNVENNEVKVTLTKAELENGYAYWGLVRSLVNNACIGVSEGFVKELELIGVGYRAEKAGSDVKLAIGYSHPVIIRAVEGITLELEGNTLIRVRGIDKHMVGQVAANIRKIREPEPYKGKGIKYKTEVVKRKQGKAAK